MQFAVQTLFLQPIPANHFYTNRKTLNSIIDYVLRFLFFLTADLAIDCGDPPAVEHAFYMEPPNTMRGAVVRYMCEEGYILSESSAVIQCEKNRAWTSVRFTCNAGIFTKYTYV